MSIKNRIIEALDMSGKTRQMLAEKLGKGRGAISDMLNKDGDIDSLRYLEATAELTGVSVEWLRTGKKGPKEYANMEEYHNEYLAKNEAQEHKRIPFYDVEAQGGSGGSDVSPISQAAGTIEVGDLLKDSEAAMRISGNSMIPNYPPGCVVGLIKRFGSFIEPGEVYVIETRDGRILKRIFYKDDRTTDDVLVCYSDNTMVFNDGPREGKSAYPPFDLLKSEIIALYTVVGVIKRNTNSMIVSKR